MIGSPGRRLLIALAFLLPNLAGFLIFTAGPIAFSLGMAFTDWALTRHNKFSDTPIRWVGAENFSRVLTGDESHLFWDYLGNTLFLMLGIPVGIAGSLAVALMIHADPAPRAIRARARSATLAVIASAIAVIGVWLLTTPGPVPIAGAPGAALSAEQGLGDLTVHRVAELRSNAAVLATAALGAVVALGLAFGSSFFRGLYYLPSLLAGVATYLLWKTLYRPEGGLINAGLRPILSSIQGAVASSPPWLWYALGIALWVLGAIWCVQLLAVGAIRLSNRESGIAAFLGRIGLAATLAACLAGSGFLLAQLPARSLFASGYAPLDRSALLRAVDQLMSTMPDADESELRLAVASLGDAASVRDAIEALTVAAPRTSGSAEAVRRAVITQARPTHDGLTAGEGLSPPQWLVDHRWAKTALILMGIWASVGGGTMLLYLAGLAGIPPELYEAAAIDGAAGWKRFIHITWPQLAPTTFFIVVMATIGGLQGGFEQAMVMTQGKADTIVLAYYIYNLAFTDQFQLGLASAVAWIMFAMIFAMTLINFRFGSRLTNE